MIIRPVEQRDLDQLHQLAQLTQYGLTTLPKDRAIFEKRVKQSLRSFEDLNDADPQGQLYLFVLEEPTSGKIVGTCGIVSKVGGFKPFYAFRVVKEIQHSTVLGSQHEHEVLTLLKNHDGPTEIGSLFLHPDYRGGGNGRLLSLSRFLFIAQWPKLFEKEVIAEMRGVVDQQGNSPFWEALGVHFFGIEFPHADMLSLINKDFIEELIPRHPVYVDLLPDEAKASIAQVHTNTAPARKLLESEGFQYNDLVDIFEAGPVLHCERDAIRIVRESQLLPVKEITPELPTETSLFLVAAIEPTFRVGKGKLVSHEDGVVIDRSLADELRLGLGQVVRFARLKPPQTL
ncbi:arginine N-succinyltransferase [Blastopirellula marina]|uniref:Arginine N-succinyltransferase n=1 Tax=Blastopirellula marina TaxID=124 RepID=A0A2S8G9P4_9BACT|nr:arginine N-succinyltransferase [Blastopirellula marina]PQO41185.1 arginine N-succinyltransferase [Blastopirellula marina]PTL46061.1 arginine N-succinyltransferase [Blastopirellula marina]